MYLDVGNFYLHALNKDLELTQLGSDLPSFFKHKSG